MPTTNWVCLCWVPIPKALSASVTVSSYNFNYTFITIYTQSPVSTFRSLSISLNFLTWVLGILGFATRGGVVCGVESYMDSSTEEVGPTEDTILALLDFLVDPLLPSKSFSSRETLSLSQEESVAKQVHAVVLLYNYYHRKRYPELEFLEFDSFCKVAVALKPSLLPYVRLKQKPDRNKVDEMDTELSLTEKAINNACDICKSLDVSKNSPVIDGCPITRVAVFLVDDKKENFHLFHSSITQGVWSAIEKDFNVPSQSSEAVVQSRSGDKRKRVTKRPPKENQIANEASLQQLAYAAIKEACGINPGDLKTLENHVVYSISKEKTAVRLYIMQCTLTNQDMNLVPINDAMESLQGPLVRKESGSWIATPVVEYFHLLHFIDEVSDWLSREGLLSIPRNSEVQKEARSYDSMLNVAPQPNTSNHVEAINGDENNLSHSKEEPLDISQSVEASMDVSNGNCQLENESFPCSSPHGETAKEVEDINSSNLKEELLENTSQSSSVTKEIQNGSCQLKDEPFQLKDEPMSNSPPRTEIAYKVEDNSSSHLKEGLLVKTSQPFVVDEFTNGSCQLKEENLLYNSSHSETVREVEDYKISNRKGKPSETMVYKKRKKSQRNGNSNKSPSKKSIATIENPGLGDRECAVTISSNTIDIDEAVTPCSQIDGKRKSLPCEDLVDSQKQMVLAEETDQTALIGGAIVVAEINDVLPISHEHVEKVFSDNKISDTATLIPDEEEERALVSFDSNLEHLRKLQLTIASKEALLSETALKVLYRKRQSLSQQLRGLSDDVALCDRNIQTIINGGEDDLALKIDVIIEGCNNACLKNAPEIEDWTNLQIINPDLPPVMTRKRLSEATFCAYSPCQELDGVCNVNGWTLPTYNISASEGGFQACVTMKGPDFECTSEGSICTTPHESRNLAASKLLDKLRSMATESLADQESLRQNN